MDEIMGTIGAIFSGLTAGALIITIIIAILGFAVLPFFIFYWIIKKAVKTGTLEALKEAKIRAEVREGMREILREVDYRAMAKVFAEENVKAHNKEHKNDPPQ